MNFDFSNKKGIIILLGVFFSVILLDVGCIYLYYSHVMKFIESQPIETKADAGVIFFGDYIEEGTSLGPDSKSRARKIVELFKSNKINQVICVGGYYYPRWKGKPHLMSQYLIENGIPSNKVFYDSLSYNTITNCREALKLIESNNIKSVIAVSAPLHIFRISGELEFNNASFASYRYVFNNLEDYWGFFKAVHHEWVSNFLSLVLQDEARNRLIKIYAAIRYNLKEIL